MREKKIKVVTVATAQKVFNAWIRQRDEDRSCISCGREVNDAGHFLSAGHHSSLRFNEVNVNGQCRHCNCFLHGNLLKYRAGLVKRYGEQKVLMLESISRKVKKWSQCELRAIIEMYK